MPLVTVCPARWVVVNLKIVEWLVAQKDLSPPSRVVPQLTLQQLKIHYHPMAGAARY